MGQVVLGTSPARWEMLLECLCPCSVPDRESPAAAGPAGHPYPGFRGQTEPAGIALEDCRVSEALNRAPGLLGTRGWTDTGDDLPPVRRASRGHAQCTDPVPAPPARGQISLVVRRRWAGGRSGGQDRAEVFIYSSSALGFCWTFPVSLRVTKNGELPHFAEHFPRSISVPVRTLREDDGFHLCQKL